MGLKRGQHGESEQERERQQGAIVITGAAGALGQAVTRAFLDLGAKRVIGADLSYAHQALKAQGGHESTIHLDATEPLSVKRVFEAARQEAGSVRAVIHCAGGFRWSTLEAISDEDLDFLLDVNLRSSLLVVREALQDLKRHQRGQIVLVSSRSTLQPGVGEGAYAATKAGINALVMSVAEELKSSACTINAVLPSVLDTPANREAMPKADFDTWVKLPDLAQIIVSLTRPLGAPINGALIPVRGRT